MDSAMAKGTVAARSGIPRILLRHNVRTSAQHMYKKQEAQIPQRDVKHSIRKAHFKSNRAFKVILIGAGRNPECMVCRRNVQLKPTLLLKLTKKLEQRENCKFVNFNDPTPV